MPETVLLVEDIMVDYVTDIMHTAEDIASTRELKLITEYILFVIRVEGLPEVWSIERNSGEGREAENC